jgi:branched-subunit amino acid aminotransferase/4-amino-4-deoxychorismate lyase
MKINSKDIFVKNLNNYNEIILVGSGKGVVSVSEIKNTIWKRKSLEIYNRLIEIYNNEIFYS